MLDTRLAESLVGPETQKRLRNAAAAAGRGGFQTRPPCPLDTPNRTLDTASMDRLQEQRELVALSSRMLGKLDLTKSTSGHVSARVAGTDTFLIRARGPAETGVGTPHRET